MRRILCIMTAVSLSGLAAFAQKGNIGFIYPAGGQRGTTFEVTVGGQGLSKAQGIVIGGDGVSGELIPQKGKPAKKRKNRNIGEEDNLQLADQVHFRITVDKDAKAGMRDVRLLMPNGMTNRLYFEVGELPDVREDGKAEISAISETLPVTFNGQVMRADVDRFRFRATKGQQLVLKVRGREFVPYMADAVPGWFQPIIRLYGPDGKEVAYNDDYTFHVDPVLFYKVPRSGYYDVEINDALYRGRGDFVYRIDVGELPYITSISPIGGPVGSTTKVHLNGYNLSTTTLKVRPAQEGPTPVRLAPRKGISSNTVLFAGSSLYQVNNPKAEAPLSRDKAWELLPGNVVENTITAPMQQHWYRLEIPRQGRYTLNVLSRRLGTPADLRLTLYNSVGRQVVDVDDVEDPDDCMATHFADPFLTTLLKPGRYYVRIVESQAKSGSEYAYRLSLDRAQPDFALYMEPPAVSVPEDGTGIFNVVVTRKQKFSGDIDLEVSGLPSGFKVAGTHLTGKEKKSIVTITAPAGAKHQVLHPKVTATATKGGLTIEREGRAVESMMQAFYYTHLMPIDEFRVEVGETQPYKISLVRDGRGPLVLDRQAPMPVKVKIERDPGFREPITLMLRCADKKVRAEAVVVEPGRDEAVLYLFSRIKNKKETYTKFSVSGVLKGRSKKSSGRAGFTAAVNAFTPAVEITVPVSPLAEK